MAAHEVIDPMSAVWRGVGNLDYEAERDRFIGKINKELPKIVEGEHVTLTSVFVELPEVTKPVLIELVVLCQRAGWTVKVGTMHNGAVLILGIL